jgi:hypothetical protein
MKKQITAESKLYLSFNSALHQVQKWTLSVIGNRLEKYLCVYLRLLAWFVQVWYEWKRGMNENFTSVAITLFVPMLMATNHSTSHAKQMWGLIYNATLKQHNIFSRYNVPIVGLLAGWTIEGTHSPHAHKVFTWWTFFAGVVFVYPALTNIGTIPRTC